MLFVYLLVLVLYTGSLSAENTTLNVTICVPKGLCPGCEERFTFCRVKDGKMLCTFKDKIIDPDSGVCDFEGCPIGETDLAVGANRSCIPMKKIVNGSLPMEWWWDGCIEPFLVNCGNYLPVCVRAFELEEYNQTMGGCINKGCPPATHPCKVESGTECISYDDLKSFQWTKGGDECIRATAEEKAAARATVPPAAQEKTEPKETSPASRPSGLLVNSVFVILTLRLLCIFSTLSG